MSDGRIQVIERAIDILTALTGGASSLAEVTQATGLPKGTAFRILQSLSYENLVAKDPVNNTYMPGHGFLRLLQGSLEGSGAIAAITKPALVSLREMTEETVTLHVRMGIERVCIEEMQSLLPIRYTASVGASDPLHVGSAGKVLLAFLEDEQLERIVPLLPLQVLTSETIGDVDELRTVLAEVRAQGWALSTGERLALAAAISVPVRLGNGLIVALSILGPSDRLTLERRIQLLPALREAASGIEAVASGMQENLTKPAGRESEKQAAPKRNGRRATTAPATRGETAKRRAKTGGRARP
ncbi:MAG TPA: IclR family transcriptional regulator [Solirubrobacteraceae bacterium]|jgi:DNA-binding IclR family transcriptional regulator